MRYPLLFVIRSVKVKAFCDIILPKALIQDGEEAIKKVGDIFEFRNNN